MKPLALVGVVLSLASLANSRAVDLDQLNVLYVGEPPNSTRAKKVTAFLKENLGRTEAVARKGFRPEQAEGFDVVLLDWPQSDKTEQEREEGSPLGARLNWRKPTVFLGSAGLNMAIVWKVRGGSG